MKGQSSRKLCLVLVIVVLSTARCDYSQDAGLTESLSLAAERDYESKDMDAPGFAVGLTWITDTNDGASTRTGLSFSVLNNLAHPIEAQVQLRFSGLMTKTATVSLGVTSLAPQALKTFEVDLDEIPLQNLVGASQISPVVVATIHLPTKTDHQTVAFPPLYYRFSDGYEEINFLSLHSLPDEPVISGSAISANGGEQRVLGRILDKSSFREVTTDDEDFRTIDAGATVGRITGASVSVGYVDSQGNLVEVER